MVSMLERAIAILERELRGDCTSFAQLKGTEVVVRALELFVDASAIAAEDAQKLSALVQMTDDDDADDEDMGAPAAATYETHSDGIVATLKEESFEVSFELTFAETSSADTFPNELTEAATDVESYSESLVGETFNFSVLATEDENDNESENDNENENDDSAPCERYDVKAIAELRPRRRKSDRTSNWICHSYSEQRGDVFVAEFGNQSPEQVLRAYTSQGHTEGQMLCGKQVLCQHGWRNRYHNTHGHHKHGCAAFAAIVRTCRRTQNLEVREENGKLLWCGAVPEEVNCRCGEGCNGVSDGREELARTVRGVHGRVVQESRRQGQGDHRTQ